MVSYYRQKASYKCQNKFALLRDPVKWKSGEKRTRTYENKYIQMASLRKGKSLQ